MEQFSFFPYSWHIDEDEKEATAIRIYGLSKENENVCVKVNNFTPYVYIELPTHIQWTQGKAQMVGNKIDQLLHDKKPVKKSLVYKHKLYGAHFKDGKRKLFPYLFCNFSTRSDIRFLSYKIRSKINVLGLGLLNLKMHEGDATEILQLISCRDLPTTGWIKFSGKRTNEFEKITLCDHEFTVRWKNLSAVSEEEINYLAKPKIMGFDIEVNSKNTSKMPCANVIGDKIFQISCIFCREGDEEKDYIKYILSLGNPNQKVTGKDVNILKFISEGELLEGFTKLVRKENPNIISGYNILGFDIPYMIDRAKFDGICFKDFVKMGFHKFNDAKEKTIKWSSSAYGDQEFQYLDTEGRVFVDLLPLVKRDYKLNNYKLKTVSTNFLGDTKDPLSVKGIFKCYREGMKGGKLGDKAMGIVAKYCVQDSVLVLRLMKYLQTWVGLCEMSKTCNVDIFSLYTKGQQIKVYSQVYKYCMYINMVVEKDGIIVKDDERYVGASVFTPVPGLYDMVVPFDFASLYPTTLIAYNIDYSTIVYDDDVPDTKCHIMEWEDHIGCIHDEKVIKKLELTKFIDKEKEKLKKLRTSRDNTLDKYRKKKIKKEIELLNESIKPYIKKRSELNKSKPKFPMCAKRKYRFLKEPKGVIPTILQDLLDARANTRKEIKENDKIIKKIKDIVEIERLHGLNSVLNKRQLSYKVSANSMYGAMGVRRGFLPFMPGAMCTTYMGRKNIEIVSETIPKEYKGELIYGDTDSNYIHFPHIKTAQEVWDYSIEVADKLTKLFPSPIVLEFENEIYSKFLILTKKRYMYRMCKRDGIVNNKIGKKGVLLARRDNSKFIRDLYEKIIENIFEGMNMDDSLYFIILEMNILFSKRLPINDFIITKAVGGVNNLTIEKFENEKGQTKGKIGNYTVTLLPTTCNSEKCYNYKSKSCEDCEKLQEKKLKDKKAENKKEFYVKSLPAQVQLAERIKERGQRCEAGTRLEYVITTNGGHKGKQYDKVESSEYFVKNSSVLELDYLYYLKSLVNPLDQVLNVIFKKEKRFVLDFTDKQYKLRIQFSKLINEIKQYSIPIVSLTE